MEKGKYMVTHKIPSGTILPVEFTASKHITLHRQRRMNLKYAFDAKYREKKKEFSRLKRLSKPEKEDSLKRRRDRQHEKREKLKKQAQCARCGFDDYRVLEIDHIIPKIKGGSNTQNNLQILCANCHTIKTWHEDQANLTNERRNVYHFLRINKAKMHGN